MPQTPERRRQYYLDRKARKDPQMKAAAAAWRDRNREHLKERNTRRRMEKRAMCLFAAARIRARKKNIAFEISPEEIERIQKIIDVGLCELSGVALTLGGPRCATTPSLDRVIPGLGYIDGNVRIICHALNTALGDWGEKELRRILVAWFAKPSGK